MFGLLKKKSKVASAVKNTQSRIQLDLKKLRGSSIYGGRDTVQKMVLDQNAKLNQPLWGMALVRQIKHWTRMASNGSKKMDPKDDGILLDGKKTKKGALHRINPAGTKISRGIAE